MVKNGYYLGIIVLGMLLSLYAFYKFYTGESISILSIERLGLPMIEFGGAALLIQNGSFKKTRNFKLLKACVSLFIISTLLKVMHWNFSSYVMGLSFFIIGILYVLHFYQKPYKRVLDVLKLLWVVTFCILTPLVIDRVLVMEYRMLSVALMLVTVAIFYLENLKQKSFKS
ncbi:hypothetical protein SAMN05216480_10356 [Pustulibacterium marinum]|uniref:Uncharacterized protein n=1 Tax=Pustulibacterium marinum TaxID=1224947 RepID=A0A1I7G1S2_9FLAO|nr:hypothetical protein [Pustulibacterium marinum]SFU42246.1 hypothetical protein SAMN05216480_10356 [Pustulibacterium marinum]